MAWAQITPHGGKTAFPEDVSMWCARYKNKPGTWLVVSLRLDFLARAGLSPGDRVAIFRGTLRDDGLILIRKADDGEPGWKLRSQNGGNRAQVILRANHIFGVNEATERTAVKARVTDEGIILTLPSWIPRQN